MTGVQTQRRNEARAAPLPRHVDARPQSGFTLTEVMAVVLVVGILLAIAIPTFLGARNRAHDVAARANLQIAVNAATITVLGAPGMDLSDAGAAALARTEPTLTFLTADQTSSGPHEISVDPESADRWVATVQSQSGTCFVAEITPQSTNAYTSKDCSASIAADISTPVNIAPMSAASMTSDWPSGSYGVENLIDGSYSTFAHSDWTSGQSVAFDFGDVYAITDIHMWNRPDCCQNRMKNMWIVVSNDPISTDLDTARSSGEPSFYLPYVIASPSTVAINASAQHVRVFSTGPVVHLAEIEIYALP